MNLAQIKKQLTANMGGESATDLHGEEDRLRAINQAYADISFDERVGQSSVTLPLIAGASTLSLPGSAVMIAPDGITTAHGKLLQVGYDDILRMQSESSERGETAYWATDPERAGTFIHFYPASIGTLSLRVNFLSIATPMSLDTDQPWGGQYPHFHKLIPMRAAMQMYREKGAGQENMAASRFWLSEYEREKAALVRQIRNESGQTTVLRIASKLPTRKRNSWRDE